MVKLFGYSKISLCLVILAMTSQCTTAGKGAISGELARPLKDVKKAVYFAFKGNVKRKSQNGRTYYSEYHRPGKNLSFSSKGQKERAILMITVLGDRRPYVVKTIYKVFKLSGGRFTTDRYDKKLAQHYLGLIEEYLASRPEERDVIDDFRPY